MTPLRLIQNIFCILAKVRLKEKPGGDAKDLLDPDMVNVIDELSSGVDNEAK